MLFTYIREEELYNLGGRDCGRVSYGEWKILAPLTCLSWNPWHLYAAARNLCCRPIPGTVARHSLPKSVPSIRLCTKSTHRNARVPSYFCFLYHIAAFPTGDFSFPSGVPVWRCLHHLWLHHQCLPASLSFLPPFAEQEMFECILLHAETLSLGVFLNFVF